MANRLEFSTSMDASGFRRGMMEIEAAANATNMRLQNLLKNKITSVDTRMSKMDPNSWEYVQAGQRKATLERSLLNVQNAMYLRGAQTRTAIAGKELEADKAIWRKGQQEWAAIQAAQTATMLANFETQRAAAAASMVEQEAMLVAVASGRGAAANVIGGAHGAGGITGIIRESLVIIREVSMGRGLGRIGGSVTLLAQYLGVLKLAVKSTATEQLLASVAATKLSKAMAIQALQARGTAAYTELLVAAQAQEAVAANAATEANIALASATTTLNPIFFIIAGLAVATGVAAIFLWRHFSLLAKEAKNLEDAMNPLKQKFTEIAEAEDKAAKARQENVNFLKNLVDMHSSESDALERKIRLLKEEARARSWTDAETLAAEKQLLLVEQARLKTELDKASAEESTASAADIAGATMTDEKGRVFNLDQAKARAKKLGEIADAAQESADNNPAMAFAMKQAQDDGMDAPAKGFMSVEGVKDSDWVRKGATNREQIAALQNVLNVNPQNFKVDGKDFSLSVDEAKNSFKIAGHQAQKLASDQEALDETLKDAKATAEEKKAALMKVQGDLQDIADEEKFPVKSKSSKKSMADGGDPLVRVGNFLGTAKSRIENIAEEQIRISRAQLGYLRSIDGKMGHTSFSGT